MSFAPDIPAIAAPVAPAPVDAVQPPLGAAPATPEAAPVEEFKYTTPDGSKYRDEQALYQGAIEKAAYIQALKEQNAALLAQRVAPQAPQQPQLSAKDQFMAEALPHYNELFGDDAAARKEAEYQWGLEFRRQQAQQQTVIAQQKTEYRDIQTADPRFDIRRTDALGFIAKGIYESYPNEGPKQHYQRFVQQVGALGGGAPAIQPQTPQGLDPRLFARPGAGGGAPAAPALHPETQAAISVYETQQRQMGKTPTPEGIEWVRNYTNNRLAKMGVQV